MFVYISNEIMMESIFKNADKTAFTTLMNKSSLPEKSQPSFNSTGRNESVGWGSPHAQTAPLTMWKIESLFVLNSLFKLRMELLNNSIYQSVTLELFLKSHLCTHLFYSLL